MFCVRICNKNDLLCYSCSKKVSSLRMGRIYRQDSRGDQMSKIEYTIVKFCTNDESWYIMNGSDCIGIITNSKIIEMVNEYNFRREEEE